jgi:hypothetical protein
MPSLGPRIGRVATFNDAVRELENGGHSGVKASVDLFIRGLRAGGGNLAATPVDDGEFTHRADNPSRGAAGRGIYCVMYRRTTRTDGSVTITLLDIWCRHSSDELTAPD